MGLITRNTHRLISLLLIISTIASFSQSFVSPVSAASVTKSAALIPPDIEVNPGDTVKITLEIQNASDLRKPADIMLVMDRTGSMNDLWGNPAEKKIVSAKKALNSFISKTTADTFIPGSPPSLGPPPSPEIPPSGSYGDYVGLVSYAYTGAICSPIPTACATLEYDLRNMTGGNKAAITTKVNNLCNGALNFCVTAPGPSTTIGSGLRLATQTLLSKGRVDVPKFILLATDGAQNWIPSPYELNILEDAVDNNITVFTIGIGDDVNDNIPIPSVTCFGCPNLDGIGGSSATEILKDIACQTDINNDSIADDCKSKWDTANDPKYNDLDNPKDAFFAINGAKLTDVYNDIQGLIKANTTFRIVEKINTRNGSGGLFESGISNLKLTDCGIIELVPSDSVSNGLWDFNFVISNLPSGQKACVTFDVVIKLEKNLPPIPPGGRLFDVDEYGALSSWESGLECSEDDGFGCIVTMWGKDLVPISQAQITVVSSVPPPSPWVKTENGNVGSLGSIQLGTWLPAGENNAEYIVIKTAGAFTSVKNWVLDGYVAEPKGPNTYSQLYDKLSGARACQLTSDEYIPNSQGKFRIDNDLEVKGYDSSFPLGCGNGKDAAVIFVDGDLEIEENLNFTRPTVFIVSGKITVDKKVTEINAVLISDKGFDDEYGNKKLTVNGSIIGALGGSDSVNLQREVDAGDRLSEHIILDPSYFYYLSDYAGVATITYKEERP